VVILEMLEDAVDKHSVNVIVLVMVLMFVVRESFMLLFDAARPNPRAVRMFLLEKEINLPSRDMDVDGGENRRADFADSIGWHLAPELTQIHRWFAATAARPSAAASLHQKSAQTGVHY